MPAWLVLCFDCAGIVSSVHAAVSSCGARFAFEDTRSGHGCRRRSGQVQILPRPENSVGSLPALESHSSVLPVVDVAVLRMFFELRTFETSESTGWRRFLDFFLTKE